MSGNLLKAPRTLVGDVNRLPSGISYSVVTASDLLGWRFLEMIDQINC